MNIFFVIIFIFTEPLNVALIKMIAILTMQYQQNWLLQTFLK